MIHDKLPINVETLNRTNSWGNVQLPWTKKKIFYKNKNDTKEIEKTVFKACKKRHTHLSMAWIDYRKAYDLVPHSWVNEYMQMFGIAENLRIFLRKSLQQWRLCMQMVKIWGKLMWKRGYFRETVYRHCCSSWVWCNCLWFLRRKMHVTNGERKNIN